MKLEGLTILPGKNKKGEPENFDKIEIKPGQIVSIVGKTGSGKSQLLYDIETLSRGDSISGRKILLNGKTIDRKTVFSSEFTMIGHVSQNLKFFVDMTVGEFINYHCEILGKGRCSMEVIELANKLTGEPISEDMRLHQLSGGQSRALMIADILIVRDSPIILADEIENAGIEKVKVLDLFRSRKDRIIILSTHDPILALSSDFRIVIKEGGISNIIYTTEKEKEILEKVKSYEIEYMEIKNKIRNGEIIG